MREILSLADGSGLFLKKALRMGIFTKPGRETGNPRPRSAAFPECLREAQAVRPTQGARPGALIPPASAGPPAELKRLKTLFTV